MFSYTSSTIINSAKTKSGESTVIKTGTKVLIHPNLSFDTSDVESVSVTKHADPTLATVTLTTSKLKSGTNYTLSLKLAGEPLRNAVDAFEDIYVSVPVLGGDTAANIVSTINQFKLNILNGVQIFKAEATSTGVKLTMSSGEIFVITAKVFDLNGAEVTGAVTKTDNEVGVGSGLYIKQHYVKDSAQSTTYGMSMEPLADGKYDQYTIVLDKKLPPSLDGPHRKRTTHIVWVLNTLIDVATTITGLTPSRDS